jgi:hypothetical protein
MSNEKVNHRTAWIQELVAKMDQDPYFGVGYGNGLRSLLRGGLTLQVDIKFIQPFSIERRTSLVLWKYAK